MAFIFIALILGPLLATVAAMAMWLALGSSTLMWRAILVGVGVSLLGLIFCAVSGELEAEWLGLVWIVVVTISAMFMFVRRQGFRLIDTTNAPANRADEFQFSVLQLIGSTAAVAVVAAFARFLVPLVVTWDAILFGFGIAVCLGGLAVVASFTTLRDRACGFRRRWFAISTVMTVAVVFAMMEVTKADPGIVWGSVVAVYALSLRALFRYARTHGFSLVAWSDAAVRS